MLLRAKDGMRGHLLDLDTGKRIKGVIWAKFHTCEQRPTEEEGRCFVGCGTFEAYQLDRNDEPKQDGNGGYLTYYANARLQWTPNPDPRVPGGMTAGHNRITDAQFKVSQVPVPKRAVHKRLEALMLDRRCMHYGCIKVAEWLAGDEVEMPPVVANGYRWPKARIVNVRFYCAQHWTGPRLLDHRGEVIKVDEDGCGCCPDTRDYGKGR